jgi:hypothetical protein
MDGRKMVIARANMERRAQNSYRLENEMLLEFSNLVKWL